ncbi:hypothetical protein HQ585_03155 [candidate division KSB1 bacterium]|nr:hypothetical protein [candidate division KSB1 bacterium]
MKPRNLTTGIKNYEQDDPEHPQTDDEHPRDDDEASESEDERRGYCGE